MSTTMLWSFWSSLIAVTVMMVTVFHVSAQADSPRSIVVPARFITPVMPRWSGTAVSSRPANRWRRYLASTGWTGARFNRIDRRHARPGVSIKVPRRLEDLAAVYSVTAGLSAGRADEKFILIDLTEQFLGAYEFGALRFRPPSPPGMDSTKRLRGSSV